MSDQQELDRVQSLTAIEEEEFKRAAARAQDKMVCWVTTAAMGLGLLQETLDISVFRVTAHSRIVASNGLSRKLIEVAEAAGYSQEMCSYYKVTIGYALLLSRGQLDLVPGVPLMPRPDFIWATNGCASSLQVGVALRRIFDVPVIGIDVPFEHDVSNRERRLDYVQSQLRQALDILETLTGRPMDWPRLAERIRGLAEVGNMRNAVNQACKSCPSVCSGFDLIPPAWAHRGGRLDESKRMYGGLKEKIEREQGRIEREERAIPDEIRLTWLGAPLPWAKIGMIKEVLARYGAVLCTVNISIGGPQERGEGLDPENPLRTLAWLHQSDARAASMDIHQADFVKPGIEGYNIDGVILHMARTCKNYGIPLLVEAAELERKFGVSVLILEADQTDMAFFSETQVEDTIEGFLESIARRKGGAREGLQKKVGG